MPTFSARLSPKSHFPGPNTGIVFGLFLFAFAGKDLQGFVRKLSEFPSSALKTLYQNKFFFARISILFCRFPGTLSCLPLSTYLRTPKNVCLAGKPKGEQ